MFASRTKKPILSLIVSNSNSFHSKIVAYLSHSEASFVLDKISLDWYRKIEQFSKNGTQIRNEETNSSIETRRFFIEFQQWRTQWKKAMLIDIKDVTNFTN